jgi:thiamine monophosphate synthase
LPANGDATGPATTSATGSAGEPRRRRRLRVASRDVGALLLVNDRLDLALEI